MIRHVDRHHDVVLAFRTVNHQPDLLEMENSRDFLHSLHDMGVEMAMYDTQSLAQRREQLSRLMMEVESQISSDQSVSVLLPEHAKAFEMIQCADSISENVMSLKRELNRCMLKKKKTISTCPSETELQGKFCQVINMDYHVFSSNISRFFHA